MEVLVCFPASLKMMVHGGASLFSNQAENDGPWCMTMVFHGGSMVPHASTHSGGKGGASLFSSQVLHLHYKCQ
jgi:hypothetical protein